MCNNKCGHECPRLIKSTAVAITGTAPNQVLTVTIPSRTLVNLQNYCLIICQPIPKGLTIPMIVLNGTVSITMECKNGNLLRSDQLNSRKRYPVIYGNDPNHMMINACVPKTGYAI